MIAGHKTLNIDLFLQLGLSGLSKERYQIDCDLGPVYRQELAVPAIKN